MSLLLAKPQTPISQLGEAILPIFLCLLLPHPPSFPLPIWDKLPSPQDFTGGSDGKVSDYNAGDPEVQSLGGEDPLEKEMATDSSTLAWKIPWTEDPDRLQSMGLQRVGHD